MFKGQSVVVYFMVFKQNNFHGTVIDSMLLSQTTKKMHSPDHATLVYQSDFLSLYTPNDNVSSVFGNDFVIVEHFEF